MGDFPFKKLSADKSTAGILRIERPDRKPLSLTDKSLPGLEGIDIDYDTEQTECHVEVDFYVLTLSASDKKFKQVIKVSHSDQKVVESETYKQGEGVVLTVQYKRYENEGGTSFPREITITLPRDETRVKIHYKEIELLSEIDSDQFSLTPPQGVEVLPLE